MFNRIINYVKRRFRGNTGIITDLEVIASSISNPDFPWFISFPRTGSHWIRMIMELYFEKPSLVQVFYYKDSKEFTCFHRHDVGLSICGVRNVLYLYRDPVDTVYSQLKYDRDNVEDENKIRHWTVLYGRHLSKWIFEETFTVKKTVITYEEMHKDMHETFKKICEHFNMPFDPEKLDIVLKNVSKEKLKRRIKTNIPVVQLSPEYEKGKHVFRGKYSSFIYKLINEQNPSLGSLFNNS